MREFDELVAEVEMVHFFFGIGSQVKRVRKLKRSGEECERTVLSVVWE